MLRRTRARALALNAASGEGVGKPPGFSLPSIRAAQRLIKRGLDVLLAVALLLSLAPLLALIALVVWLGSPGPVFYHQVRAGKDGRPFRLYKFRTMLADSDPGIHEDYYRRLVVGEADSIEGAFKLARDPRITRAGRFLRRFSLDELPQLWNVLKGDMSLVGPRPPILYEVELYGSRERRRLSVVPGLTGLWQVSGRNCLDFQEVIDLDLAYIERWSIWLDLVIMLRTPFVVLSGNGAC